MKLIFKYQQGKNILAPKSELNWDYKDWFSKRSDHSYSQRDIESFNNHIPEYLEIEQKAKTDGTWLNMPNGQKWEGDPRSWVMMQSKAFKKNYQDKPWWSGQGSWIDKDGISLTVKTPRYNGQMWFSDNEHYGDAFAYDYNKKGTTSRQNNPDQQDISGYNYLSAIPKKGNYRYLEKPKQDTYDWWQQMPYEKVGNNIKRIESIYKGKPGFRGGMVTGIPKFNQYDNTKIKSLNLRNDKKKVLTDDIVNWSKDLGDDGIFMYNVDDGPTTTDANKTRASNPRQVINEFISQPGFTNKIKFIEGNNGNFDIKDPYKYAFNKTDKKIYAKKGIKLIKRK